MNARYLLGIALAAATAVAACGSPDASQLGNGSSDGNGDPAGNGGPATGPGAGTSGGGATGGSSGAPGTPGNLPTASKAGKAFFIASVYPILDTKCSGCHTPGGIGNPSWMAKSDAAATYDLIYTNAYAVAQSRIVIKGVHSNGAAPELTVAEKQTWAQWISLEVADGGQKAQVNVLEKFGGCFDQAKFDAINLGSLRTIRRQTGNNPQNLNENANNCTGCDNKPCSTCHSSDDVTGFINAIGNPIFPADYTFQETKLLNPAFIRQYVSTTPTGTPIYNPGLMTKSTNTIEKAPAYSHPMFKIPDTMETAIQAFVADAIAKQAAPGSTCGM